MTRVLVFALIAFAVGLVGGTAGRLPALRAERAAGDTAAVEAPRAATEQPAAVGAGSRTGATGITSGIASDAVPAGGGAAEPASEASREAPHPGDPSAPAYEPASPTPASVDGPPTAAATDRTISPTYSEDGAEKLAEIFAAMDAVAAASILEGLEPEEIRMILPRMESDRAAEILSAMDPERAAALSRVVLIDTSEAR